MIIAVLPFTNLTADPANAYFADGAAEAIGDTLALTARLRLSPHASALDWTDRGGSPQEIAAGLGAEAVLEGERSGRPTRCTSRSGSGPPMVPRSGPRWSIGPPPKSSPLRRK